MIKDLKHYDTALEAAKQIGVHSATVRRWIGNGKIKKARYELDMWFIPKKETERLKKEKETKKREVKPRASRARKRRKKRNKKLSEQG
jgi:predicted site-specific integrase-resolvase